MLMPTRIEAKLSAAIKAYNHAVTTGNTRRWKYWNRQVDRYEKALFKSTPVYYMSFEELVADMGIEPVHYRDPNREPWDFDVMGSG